MPIPVKFPAISSSKAFASSGLRNTHNFVYFGTIVIVNVNTQKEGAQNRQSNYCVFCTPVVEFLHQIRFYISLFIFHYQSTLFSNLLSKKLSKVLFSGVFFIWDSL